ncbi:MCE family protein [candidate division KSB1 bacterium]|nr:MCE family protein [candidate division KSB1 bacterium]
MDYRPQEIKAGLMVVVSAILLIAFLIAVSGLKLFKKTNEYTVRYDYTGGLEVGSTVRFGGMEVGVIKDMHIYPKDNSLIEFVLEIDDSIPVKTNSEAMVTSIGLMGEQHINITTGHPDSALLPPGSLLRAKEVPSLSQLAEPMAEIATQVNETLTEIRALFGSDNQKQIASIFVNLNDLLEKNQESIATMMENTNKAIQDLNSLTDKVDDLLLNNESNISNSMQHLEETLQQTKNLMKHVDRMIVDLDNVVLTKGTNFNEIMDNLQRTTGNLEEFSRSIKDRPWQLIRKSAPADRDIEK